MPQKKRGYASVNSTTAIERRWVLEIVTESGRWRRWSGASLLVVVRVLAPVVVRVIVRVVLEVDTIEHGADDLGARLLQLLERTDGGVTAGHFGADHKDDASCMMRHERGIGH